MADDRTVIWPERWVKKRYGLLLLFLLIIWPFSWALWSFVPGLESIIANGFLLDSYSQLVFLTVTNVVAFFFAISILRLLNDQNPGGSLSLWLAGDCKTPWGSQRVIAVSAIAMIAPLTLSIFFRSEFGVHAILHIPITLVTVAISTLFGVGILFLLGIIKCKLAGSYEETANFFPFEDRNSTGIGVLVRFSKRLENFLCRLGFRPADLQFLIYFAFLALIHRAIVGNLEANAYWLTSAPSMLVLFSWLALMVMAGLASWLDRWRIPVIPVIILILALLLSLRGSTKSFDVIADRSRSSFVEQIAKIRDKENELLQEGGDIKERRELVESSMEPLETAAWSAIFKRMENLEQYNDNGKGKTLVVVTCPGGGIHAAAWAACVLDQLSMEYVEFKDSLCVVSGVSGGSVGTLMFIGSRYEDELLERKIVGAAPSTTEEVHRQLKEKNPALELASRSSLEAIAFGATIDDLYNLMFIPGVGRGQRLEDSLNSRLSESLQDLTLGDWGDRALNGNVPIVIFNSTDAITGRRILFDTIPTPTRLSSVGLTARPLNYRELLEVGFDVRPATAARTSATFPYISPFTKPAKASLWGEHVAICDGGYVDNEGIVTALNWVEFLLKRWANNSLQPKPFDRILLLRIEPSSNVDRNEIPDSGGPLGWFRWLTGPVETMGKVRSASQLERGNLETDLSALYFKFGGPQRKETANLTQGSKEKLQSQNIVDIPEFDKRTTQPQEIRDNWEQKLRDFETQLQLDYHEENSRSTKPLADLGKPDDSPPVGTVFEDPNDELPADSPVVVQTIRFIDANQVIPLNWKLSNRQKLGYLLAWKLCSGEDTTLRRTLDTYFTRAKKQHLSTSNTSSFGD